MNLGAAPKPSPAASPGTVALSTTDQPSAQPVAVEATIAEFRYPRAAQPTLQEVTLKVSRGEFVVVVGQSGSGKTTLAYCLAGVIPHFFGGTFRGQVRIGGQDLARLRLPEISRLVGLVLQRPESQLFTRTVAEDIAFGPENLELDTVEIRERVARSLAAVGLVGFESRLTDSLSGGEIQRVALASVLALDPEVLILDQPTAELDAHGRRQVYEHLASLNRRSGRTVVVVADRLRDVLPYATRVIHLDGGRIASETPPRPAVGSEATGPGRRKAGPNIPTMPPFPRATQSLRVTQKANNPGVGRPDQEPLLEARGLGYRFPGATHWALRDVEFGLRRGEVTAIVGANGAGKSTLARHFVGLLRPTRGQVRVLGRDARGLSTARLSDAVGYLFQDPDYQLFADSVFAEVAYGLRVRRLPEAQIEVAVRAALEAVGLLALRDRHPYTLSRLQRQRLALASILVRQPQVLVADEPTAGFDEREAAGVMEALAGVVRRGGAVLLITHDLALVARYAARMIVLAAGQVQLDVPTDRLHDFAHELARVGLFVPVPEEEGW